jgi:hypothetical protein
MKTEEIGVWTASPADGRCKQKMPSWHLLVVLSTGIKHDMIHSASVRSKHDSYNVNVVTTLVVTYLGRHLDTIG